MGADGLSPTWDICPCCGVEFGYGDCTPASVRKKRKASVDNGTSWVDPRIEPDGWNFGGQEQKIPNEFL